MKTPKYITTAASRTLDTATPTETPQARHLRQIVTPARTGGRTGRNRKRRAGIGMPLAIAIMAGIAIALAALTALTIQP